MIEYFMDFLWLTVVLVAFWFFSMSMIKNGDILFYIPFFLFAFILCYKVAFGFYNVIEFWPIFLLKLLINVLVFWMLLILRWENEYS